jgi:hypothetical protein
MEMSAHEGFLFQSIVYEGKIHVLPKTFSPLDPGIRSDGTGYISAFRWGAGG